VAGTPRRWPAGPWTSASPPQEGPNSQAYENRRNQLAFLIQSNESGLRLGDFDDPQRHGVDAASAALAFPGTRLVWSSSSAAPEPVRHAGDWNDGLAAGGNRFAKYGLRCRTLAERFDERLQISRHVFTMQCGLPRRQVQRQNSGNSNRHDAPTPNSCFETTPPICLYELPAP